MTFSTLVPNSEFQAALSPGITTLERWGEGKQTTGSLYLEFWGLSLTLLPPALVFTVFILLFRVLLPGFRTTFNGRDVVEDA